MEILCIIFLAIGVVIMENRIETEIRLINDFNHKLSEENIKLRIELNTLQIENKFLKEDYYETRAKLKVKGSL